MKNRIFSCVECKKNTLNLKQSLKHKGMNHTVTQLKEEPRKIPLNYGKKIVGFITLCLLLIVFTVPAQAKSSKATHHFYSKGIYRPHIKLFSIKHTVKSYKLIKSSYHKVKLVTFKYKLYKGIK